HVTGVQTCALPILIFLLVQGLLQRFIIEAKYLLKDENSAFQGLQLVLQRLKGLLDVSLKVEVREVRLFESTQDFGKIYLAQLAEKVLLLALHRFQVVSAVVYNRLDKVRLEVDDLPRFHGQEPQKGLLYNILRVFLAPHEIIGNGLEEGLIEGNRLSM